MTSPTKSPGVFSSEHGVSPPTSSDSSLGRGYNKEKGADGLVGYDEVVGAAVPTMSKKEEAKLIAQIDLRVLPVLCAMFTLAFLDKVNIANAATFNLSKELKLEGTQYNNCVSPSWEAVSSPEDNRSYLHGSSSSLSNTFRTWCSKSLRT